MPDGGFSFDNYGTDAAGNPITSASGPAVDPGIMAYVGKLLNGFGNGVQSGMSNPNMLPFLGMAQGAGAASTPSRMPVTKGMVFGDLAGGWAGGMQAGQQAQLMQQQTQAAQLKNALDAMTVRGYGALQQQNGMAGPPTGAGAIAQSMTPPGGGSGGGYAPMGMPNMGPPGVNTNQPGWYMRTANQPAMAAAGMPNAAAVSGGAAASGNGAPPAGNGSAGSAPLFNPAALVQQYRIYAATPGMQGMAAQVLDVLNRGLPEGAYMSQDGTLHARPGYSNYQITKSLAEKGLTQNPDGSFGVPAGELSGLTAIANTKPEVVRGEGATLMQNGRPVWQNPMVIKSVDQSGTPFDNLVYTGRGASGGGAGAVAAPGGAGAGTGASGAPAGTAGRYQTGLNPMQAASAAKRGTELEDYGATLATNATNAVNQNFLIDQMRNESGSGAGWVPGRFSEWGGELKSLFNGVLPNASDSINASLANYQAFQKNAMALTTQATRAVSPRAAVQEMQMIRQAMPQAETSAGGLNYIFNQLGANNDFMIAKQQAADSWRPAHSGTLDGFETNWNKSVSPYAFFVHRLDSGDLGTMINNLQGSTQGRALIAKMRSEVTFAQQNNLFQDGGQ